MELRAFGIMCRAGVGYVVNIDVLSRMVFLLPLKCHLGSSATTICYFYCLREPWKFAVTTLIRALESLAKVIENQDLERRTVRNL